MARHKVCFIVCQYYPEWGGIARSASRLVRYLTEAGMELHIIHPIVKENDDKVKNESRQLLDCANTPEVDENGACIYRPIINGMDRRMSMLMELIKILDWRHHFDLFHGYWLPMAFPCLMVASSGNRPVIASIRGNDAATSALLPEDFACTQTVLNNASWITSVSSDLIVSACGLADISQKSSVILNGIDATGFPSWQGFEETKGVVGTVGELRFKKAIPVLVEAYSRLPRALRKSLILGGAYSDPHEEETVENLVSMLELNAEQVNTGYLERKELLNKLVNYNVYVVCSYHDGLPNTLLDAAACGVPIVATRVGGMADVLVDRVNALLVDPGDPGQLADAISELLDSPALCNKLSKGGLSLAARLTCEQEKNSWLEVYDRFLMPRSYSAPKIVIND